MARYDKCIERLQQMAGRTLSDAEVEAIYTRIHKAALDVKAGRVDIQDVTMNRLGGAGKDIRKAGNKAEGDTLIQRAADQAVMEMEAEAAAIERRAYLQVLRLAARTTDVAGNLAAGYGSIDAVKYALVRNYSGRLNVESLEQRYFGKQADYSRRLQATWDALGFDFLGFFQNKDKLLDLVRALRGDPNVSADASAGAKAFHDVAELARQQFNDAGGLVGKLDDWGHPQHHSQKKVANAADSTDRDANQKAWVDFVFPLLDRMRYVDPVTGQAMSDSEVRAFLDAAWLTIATDGLSKVTPGQSGGWGARANRHGEQRQIHLKDAQADIDYWERFGEKTALEILNGHIEVMAKDVAFIEYLGPNPDMTYRTLRDAALTQAAVADPRATEQLKGAAAGLDNLYEYISGNTKPTYRENLKTVADTLAHLNTAGKLGGAALASLFGDRVMMEAVSHMNNLPMIVRWRDTLKLANPFNPADRRALRRQGMMLELARSSLSRFYEGLGTSSFTGRVANAVMRLSLMNAVNEIPKAAFELNMLSAIGHELASGRTFATLDQSDIRMLRTFGVTNQDWMIWGLAQRQRLAGVDNVLTPEAIARIPDADLIAAGAIAQTATAKEAEQARSDAIVKLLGATKTEGEFALVTPGWEERATFYGGEQRGTVKGELVRSMLQFKTFPWAFLQRGMDAITNQDTPTSKAMMAVYLLGATTMMGAMLLQTREMLGGRDPLSMLDENWYKFWIKSFIAGGALGIYGDFLYGASETRYGSGVLEAVSGPTIGPLLEMFLVQPLGAIRGAMDGKETHLLAKTLGDVKGFVPGGNLWYTKTALDHLLWQRAMESLSPGYLTTMRQKALKDYGQEYWWEPGETAPARAPDLGAAVER